MEGTIVIDLNEANVDNATDSKFVKWVQLTDLHFFESASQNLQERSLKDLLDISFVLITGDLKQYGQSYDKTLEFLSTISSGMKLKEKSLFFVPGNHDITGFDGRENCIETIDNQLWNNADSYVPFREKLIDAYKDYLEMADKACGEGFYSKSDMLFCLKQWNNRLNLLHVNTSLLCDGDTNKKQIIDTYGLSRLKTNRLSTIVIMHHDFFALHIDHQEIFKRLMVDLNVQACLSGHIHQSSNRKIVLPNGREIPNIICGKTLNQPGDHGSDNCIITYEWDLCRGSVLARPYKWDKTRFVPSYTFNTDDEVKNNVHGVSFPISNGNYADIEDNKLRQYKEEKGKKTNGLIHLDESSLGEYQKSVEHLKPTLHVNSNIETLIKASLANLIKDFLLPDDSTLQEEVVRLIRSETKAVFITGDSGIGKTSSLVQIAVSLAKQKREQILLTQLGSRNDEEVVDSLIYQVELYGEERVVIFIDNPFDNPDELQRATSRLNAPNVQFVLSERRNRISLIADEFLPEEYCDLAHCIVLINKSRRLDDHFFKRANTRCYTVMADWKKRIITQLFNSRLENEESNCAILSAINEIFNADISIVENYYRIAIQYNKQSDLSVDLNRRAKIKLDWDEWFNLFSEFDRTGNTNTNLKDIFPFIAALDLFKIRTSVQLISKLTGLGISALNKALRDHLSPEKGSEPAAYYTDGNSLTVALKHDVISELYFDINLTEPSLFLKDVIKYLDEDTIITFEKVVFKRRYVQEEVTTPAKIKVLPLLQEFCSHQEYFDILARHNRLYSLELAKVWSIPTSNSATLNAEWKKLLEKYNKKGFIGRKVWASYFDDYGRRLPNLVIDEGLSDNSFLLRRLLKKDIFDAEKVCSLWNEVLKEYYSEGAMPLQEFRQLIIDYSRHEFPIPNEVARITEYVEYQVVNNTLQMFEPFVKKNGLNEKQFYALSIYILKGIAEQHPGDSHSRLTLARYYVKIGDYKNAIDVCKAVLKVEPYAYRALNALGDLIAKRAHNEFPTIITKTEYEKLCKEAEGYFMEAAHHAPEHEKAVIYTALGNFQYRTIRHYSDAIDSFKNALQYRKGRLAFPTYIGMAMLYANFNKSNDNYSESEAKRMYECAIANCKTSDTRLISAYVPYAIFLYSLGEFYEAKLKLDAALKLAPKEPKALSLIAKINSEESWLENLKNQELPADFSFQDIMRQTYENPGIFFDDSKRNAIYALIVKFVYSEPQICDEVECVANINRNLIKSGYIKSNDIHSYRIQQIILRLLIRLNYNEYAPTNFRTICFFVGRTINYDRYIARDNARWRLVDIEHEAVIVDNSSLLENDYYHETKRQFKDRIRRNKGGRKSK